MTTLKEFEQTARTVRNWGRWGADDQRGTLNLITPDVRLRALASVVSGEVLSLSLPFSMHGPQDGTSARGRFNPLLTMLSANLPMGPDPAAAYSDDMVVMPLQAATHWDALAHISYRGQMYNGVPADRVDVYGASSLAIDSTGPIVSRGVLLDVARHEGADALPGGTEVTAGMLRATEEAQGVEVRTGDILLIRTGQMSHFLAGDLDRYIRPNSGLGVDSVLYFHERDVAAVATDTRSFELTPSTQPDVVLPVHVLCLVMMGLTQGQNFNLEELAMSCARDGRYDFLLAASPLPFEHGTGGPVNAVTLR